MNIRFHNSLSHAVETFEPLEPPIVRMYNCGPTVYDYAHIGNFRSFLFADVLRRFLDLAGYDVRQVMNITDVGHMTDDQLADGGGEDKMQAAAQRLKEAKKSGRAPVDDPNDPYQIADYYTGAFVEDARALGMKIVEDDPAHMPRATAYVRQMQDMIARLIERGHAYQADDAAVYFSVESFPDYGRLSGNTLDKLRGGAGGRVLDEHQAVKRHPADFLLWKPDATHLMRWDGPWGTGYPGWHIECSAMAAAVHGRDEIDIHTGGEDNIFPHHECEIAQSRGASGKPRFARFWMHARHLMVEGEKMAKSKGNFFTVRQLIEEGVDPKVIRYELIKGHYRSNLNFTRKGLEDSARAVVRLRETAAALEKQAGDEAATADVGHPLVRAFAEALADDLNMAGALGALFSWLGENKPADARGAAAALAALRAVDSVLNVITPATVRAAGAMDQQAAQTLAAEIDAARARKDYAAADALRARLIEAGYDVKTTRDSTTVQRRLA
jgi:cysteinyl-tRNA synthetase